MNVFDLLLVQPIFNILLFIYSIIPGHDFGLALIVFTVLIRFLLWPLVRRQLHQTKLMQKMQPEVAKIKARTKGNRQMESQLLMELYRERGVNPFGSIGLLLLQLPILLTLYSVVRLMTTNTGHNIAKYAYSFLQHISYVQTVIAHPSQFNDTLFGVIDLTKVAIGKDGVYIPILLLAIAAAILQAWQSQQLLPKVKEGRKLRDILKEQASGKEIDQSEMSALMTKRMSYFFPVITFVVSIYLTGALVVYLFTSSAVAVWQQRAVLRQDDVELEAEADKLGAKQAKKNKRSAVKEATIVSTPSTKEDKK